jgi:FkbM family methyltransferase
MMDVLIEGCRPFYFKGKARLLNVVAAKSGIKHARIFDSVFELNIEDHVQRNLYWGTFEHYEMRLVQQYLRPGMTFVDVGANIGCYTALGARQVAGNGGRVISFEPSSHAFEKLQSMVRGNKLEHVTVVNAGLSDTAGPRKLYLDPRFHNHTPTMVAHGNEHATATEVAVTTLDDEAARLGIGQIDLIKIDVEGYEPKVLGGARRMLNEGRIRAILCEFDEGWLRKGGSSPRQLEDFIRDAGFVDRNYPGMLRFFQLPDGRMK